MQTIVYENSLFRVEHVANCVIPGYLIIHLQQACTSFAAMDAEVARAFGPLLTKTVAAVEKVVQPEVVYVTRFGEELRQIHFHIFPRSKVMGEAYRQHHNLGNAPINGSLMFDWARKFYASTTAQDIHPSCQEAMHALRLALAEQI